MITFPGLNLEFNISRVAFAICGIDIYWYSICIVLGILVATFICKISKINYGIKYDDLLEAIAVAIFWGIIGARIYYIVFNLNYYLESPLKMLALRDGGLAIYGGIILGVVGLTIFCKKKRIKILQLLDYIIPSMAIAQSIGRWGNFFNQEAYGIETNSFLRMGILELGIYKEVHPTFLYESICTFIIFLFLYNFQKHKSYDGQILLLYLISYSGIRAIIEGLRTDSLMIFNIRISQALSITIFVVAGIILLKNRKKEQDIKNDGD